MGAIGGLFSGVLGLIGSMQQAAAAKERGAAQAYALHYQAQIARYNAMFSSRLGQNQAEGQSFKTAANAGAIRAAQAANNVDVNSGTNFRVQTSAEELGKADAMTIRANAARQAYGYTASAKLEDIEADEAKKAAGIDASAAMLSGFGSLISGASQLFTNVGFGGGSYGGYAGADYSGGTYGGGSGSSTGNNVSFIPVSGSLSSPGL